MKVLGIIADVSVKTGTGHFFRCLNFAKFFRNQFDVIFFLKNSSNDVADIIQSNGFGYSTSPTIKNVDVLLVDHYGIDQKWEHSIRSKVKKIIVFDDLANRKHDCDVLVDASDFHKNKYEKIVPESCIKLIGKEYFLNTFAFKIKPKKIKKIKKISIFFGGMDYDNTLKAIEILKKQKYKHIFFHLIVGGMNPNRLKLKKLVKPFENFSFHCQPKNYQKLIYSTDLAVGSAGVASIERCYMGIPSLVTQIVSNQKENFKFLTQQKVAIGFSWDSMEKQLDSVLRKPVLAERIHRRCLDLFVDERKKYKKNILSTLITLKKAGLEDSKFIHQLRNSKDVRSNSLNASSIPFSKHQRWFNEALRGKKHIFFVIRDLDHKPIGYLRYEVFDTSLRVSIAVQKKFRSMGYGRNILFLGEKKVLEYCRKSKIRVKKFVAEILKHNKSSVEIFQKNGFTQIDEGKFMKGINENR